MIGAAQSLFPLSVAVAACAVGQGGALWPDEDAAMLRAVPARRAEFAAGRTAARQALALMGQVDISIPMGPDRAPVWPAGLVGTITHAGGLALAACARGFAGIGLDLEPATPLDPDLVASLCLPSEQDWLSRQPAPGLAAKLIFCAKEAAYKAQYPVSKQIFDFQTLEITLQGQSLTARFQRPIPPFPAGFSFEGRSAHVEGHLLAGFTLTACWTRAG